MGLREVMSEREWGIKKILLCLTHAIHSHASLWADSGALGYERKRARRSCVGGIEHGSREKNKLACDDIFHFHPGKHKKNKRTNFHRDYELWQLRFLGKIVISWLIKFLLRDPGKTWERGCQYAVGNATSVKSTSWFWHTFNCYFPASS